MTEPTLSRDDVLADLAALAALFREQLRDHIADEIDAIADWLQQTCVVEGGHRWSVPLEPGVHEPTCLTCGQRREAAEATA